MSDETPAPPSRTTWPRTAPSRRRTPFRPTPCWPTPRSTTRPTPTTRASGPARPPSCSTWQRDWDTVLDWELPFAKWFVGGKLNVSDNCLDRHVAAGSGDQVAFHWEGEPGDTRTITYADLLAEVQRFANVLKGLGVAKGDRVAIYMPMIPELPVADAGLRPHRRRPLGGVRRLLRRLAGRPHQRRRVQGARHRRRRLAPRQAGAAQAHRRRRRWPTRRQRRARGRGRRIALPGGDVPTSP